MLCRLEAEVREAQLRAKQELLRGAQIAQEVAARELAQQRAAYEHRIEALEAQLVTASFLLPSTLVTPVLASGWGGRRGGCRRRGSAAGGGQEALDPHYFRSAASPLPRPSGSVCSPTA